MKLRGQKSPSARPGLRTPAEPSSRRRLWLLRFTLPLLPFFLLGLLEVSLRLGGYGYDPHFFKRLKIGGEEFFVQNENFSARFFPKELERHPGPLRFPARKAPGAFRIFILGESAAMGDPAQSFAPDRFLEALLRHKYPGRQFEVINTAFTAINSHAILPIARECAAHEGDLWIIYMGNNEMVGPFGAATVFGSQAPSLPYARLILGLQRLRAGQWLMELGRHWADPRTPATAWGGMGMFLRNQIAPDDSRKETVYRNFQINLHDIARAGINAGAKVLLNTVAVNLKDSPPFASISGRHLSAADRASIDQLYTNGMRALAQTDFAKAAEFFARAAQRDARSAELQFHWGECLLAQTNGADARAHFQLACDYDALPFRADSSINAAIRAEGEKLGNEPCILFDAAAALGARGGTGIPGQETFYEHVHFDFDARYELGLAWAEQIEPLLGRNTNAWLSLAACNQSLGLSAWNRAQVIHVMLERMETPPLSLQPNHLRRREALEARINRLAAQMTADNAAKTRRTFLRMLEQRPDDYFLHQEFAVFLELVGDRSAAVAEWRRFRELLPQDFLGYYAAGRLLNAQQRYAQAEALLRFALAMRPGRTDGWLELGNALALQDKPAEALPCYSMALKQDPQSPQTFLRRGQALARLNRHAEAMESYRAAIQLNPADGSAHRELGVELAATGDSAAAGKEFGEAARLNPDHAATRFSFGAWLMNQSHWEEAQREFEAVVRLEPGNLPAQTNLAFLQARKKPTP